MDPVRWVDLGAVDGPTMVNAFVAVAESVGRGASPATILSVHPAAPFANVGYHQEEEREIDLDYCRAAGIPVVRRVVGGGAILDGPWEQDYMVVVPDGAPGTTAGVEGFYAHYLAPVRSALSRLGVPAERGGVNDLTARGRKISANGALALGGAWVLTGDLLLDLDIALMTRVLRVPDEKFREKLAGGLAEWLTSLRRELGRAPDRAVVAAALREAFARELGATTVDGTLSPAESARRAALRSERSGEDWTLLKDASHPRLRGRPDLVPGRSVKIADGTTLGRADVKGGKLVRATVLARAGRIEEVELSGDFFTVPFAGAIEALEAALAGAWVKRTDLVARIEAWRTAGGIRLVGVGAEEIARAIVAAGGAPVPPP